jgi:hypothetical protein
LISGGLTYSFSGFFQTGNPWFDLSLGVLIVPSIFIGLLTLFKFWRANEISYARTKLLDWLKISEEFRDKPI